jgi:RNA polymerase sigma-70 factor (ECF subfamily)
MTSRPEFSQDPDLDPSGDGSRAAQADAERGLVRLAQSGDREAFMALVGQYQRQCAAIALRLLDNPHDTSDLLQDCFLRAFERIGSLKDGARFGSWLMRIVTNRGLNFRRARNKRRLVSLDAPAPGRESKGDTLSDVVAAGSSPDFATHSKEFRAAIDRAMSKLPDRQRAALVLFTIRELPQKQIAEILGCSVEAVKWYVFTARRELRRELAEFLEE